MATLRIAIWGGWAYNRPGDDIILRTLRDGLIERLPGVEVTGLTIGRSTATHDGAILPVSHVTPETVAPYDVFIIGPGGNWPGVAELVDMAATAIRPTITIGVGYCNLAGDDPASGADQCEGLLWRMRYIGCRDMIMEGIARKATAPGVSVSLCPDLAYAARFPQARQTHLGSPGPAAICTQAYLPGAFREYIEDLARYLLDEGSEVWALPNANPAGQTDMMACAALAERVPGIRLIEACCDVEEFAGYLSQIGCLYSTRKHGAIMAQLMGIPSAVIDWTGAFAPLQLVAGGFSKVLGNRQGPGDPAEWRAGLGLPDDWSERLLSARERVETEITVVCEWIRRTIYDPAVPRHNKRRHLR